MAQDKSFHIVVFEAKSDFQKLECLVTTLPHKPMSADRKQRQFVFLSAGRDAKIGSHHHSDK